MSNDETEMPSSHAAAAVAPAARAWWLSGTRGGPTALPIAILVALVGLLLFGASGASAAKSVAGTFGSEGTQAGQFAFPAGVAINQGTGAVYVADADCCSFTSGGQRIMQFSTDGTFVRGFGWGVATGATALEVCTTTCRAGIGGSGDGQLSLGGDNSAWPQLAVDQSDGSVYVADNLNNRIQRFSADGAFLGQFGSLGSAPGELSLPQGVAVDPTSGDVFVADTNNSRVQRFTSAGAFVSEIGGSGSGDGQFVTPSRVAVDSLGRLYVLDRGNGRVQRFDSTGVFETVFGAAAVSSPTDLAVNPANDHVYVAGSSPDISTQGIVEMDPSGAGVDIHAPNTGISSFSAGLSVDASTGRIYASSPFNPKSALVLDEVSAPTVAIDAVSGITGTEATFNGTVNPQGPPNTRYHFEYSADGSTWTPLPAQAVSVGEGVTDVAVSQTASGLAPNTDYSVRLVATKDLNPGFVASSEVTFTTDLAPPLVRSLAVGSRTDSIAWLGAEVNPQNSQSGAYLEYTLASDVAYTNSARVPLSPNVVDVGDGGAFVTIAQMVSGLQPETEYRFRTIASNVAGETVGPDRTFVTRSPSPVPPLARAWEMVSPLDKNGADIDRNLPNDTRYSTSGAAASGEAVAYASRTPFAGAGSGAFESQYHSARGEKGWTTRGISPPMEPASMYDVVSPEVWALSEDVSKAVVTSNTSLTPDVKGLLGGSWGLFLQSNSGPQSTYELLSAPDFALPIDPDLQPSGDNRFAFAGASNDMRYVVFESSRPLTADSPPAGGVYSWTDGKATLVNKLPTEEPVLAFAGSRANNGQFHPGDHLISQDGQRVFFTDATLGTLYVREGGDETRLVSSSESAPAVPQPATFMAGRASDGGAALFTSRAKLTSDATACAQDCVGGAPRPDLYLWNADGAGDDRLADLTTGDTSGAAVLGLAGVADDVSAAYFVARGVLADGGVAGRPNLYRWAQADGVVHVAALVDQDEAMWGIARDLPNPQFRDARISEDGAQLLFASRARLTARDNGGTRQLYLYDADADRLVCISCGDGASVSTGDSWLFYPDSAADVKVRMPTRLPRNLSADGGRAFFETAQALVPADVNGETDVYMWAAGELSLISTGLGGGPAEFVDASADGRDVFLTTRERLVGADIDSQIDVYDARIGGGFAEQQIPPACVGDICQGSFSPKPVLTGVVSSFGSEEAPLSPRPSLSVRRLSGGQRRALAAGRRATLVVRVTTAGRVSARGAAKIGRRTRTVISTTKRVRSAGRVRLPLRLSRIARVQLAKSGLLRISLRVTLAGAENPRAMLVLLASRSNGRGPR